MRKHSFTLNFAGENFYLETDSEVINQLVSEYFSKHLSVEDSYSARIEVLEKKIFSPLPSSARLMLRYFALKIFQSQGWSYFTDFLSYFLLEPKGKNAWGYIAPETLERHQGRFFTGIFLSFVFFELLRHLGIYFIHCAGLVSPQGRIYLFPGGSGQGKTTLSVYLIEQGFKYLSDDTIFLRENEQELYFYGFHKPCHLPKNLFSKFPTNIRFDYEDKERGKVEIDLEALFPKSRLDCARGEVVLVFPERKDQSHSDLKPLSKNQALVRLMEQSPFFYLNPSLAKRHLEVISRLVNSARIWAFESGPDWLQEPAILLQLLQRAEGGTEYESSTG